MRSKTVKHYIPYILSGVFGLFIRTAIYTAKGASYAINGRDLLNAALLVLAVWCVCRISDAKK